MWDVTEKCRCLSYNIPPGKSWLNQKSFQHHVTHNVVLAITVDDVFAVSTIGISQLFPFRFLHQWKTDHLKVSVGGVVRRNTRPAPKVHWSEKKNTTSTCQGLKFRTRDANILMTWWWCRSWWCKPGIHGSFPENAKREVGWDATHQIACRVHGWCKY